MQRLKGLPILGELVPEGLPYPAVYLVEFDPDSLWHETSLMIASYSATHGIKTDYHTFTRSPDEIREAFRELGVNPEKLESQGMLRLLDSHTIASGQSAEHLKWKFERSLDVRDWGESPFEDLKESSHVLHIDENNSVLLDHNDEKAFLGWFRLLDRFVARATPNLVLIHSLITEVSPPALYHKAEELSSGIIDFRSIERGERIEQSVRIRVLRGATHDSSWRSLRLQENGIVRIVEAENHAAKSTAIARSEISPPMRDEPAGGSRESKRRLAAIMFTDIVAYTAIGQKNESLALSLVDEQRILLKPIINQHVGREVKTIGDAILAEFPSALSAVRCAFEIQEAAREFNSSRPEQRKLHLRIGVHLGDVVESDGDIAGDAVNVASRIESLAEDGGVCVTRQVYDQVENKFEHPLTSLGPKLLKNVKAPLELYKIEMPQETLSPDVMSGLDKRRVAVLPFKNMSPDPNDEYFSDGITEELLTVLSKVSDLTVIARTSVMQYKNSTKRAADVGRELKTGTLIEGSVRKAANKIRISVQMIDAGTEGHLWAENYDRQMDDIFTIQREIAEKIADALKVKLVDSQRQMLERRPTRSTEAYTLYLKGRYYWNRRTKPSVEKGIEYLKRAIVEDPNLALAKSDLADAYNVGAAYGLMSAAEAYVKVNEYAAKALEIDPSLSQPHANLATVHEGNFRWADAEEEFKLAIKLNPNNANAHHWYAGYLERRRRTRDAMEHLLKAKELDPLSLIIATALGSLLVERGEKEKGLDMLRGVVDMNDAFVPGHVELAAAYLKAGMKDEGVKETRRVQALATWRQGLAVQANLLARAGLRQEAGVLMSKLLDSSSSEYADPFEVAGAYAVMGEEANALTWLEKAVNEKSARAINISIDDSFDSLRDNPKFKTLLSQVGSV